MSLLVFMVYDPKGGAALAPNEEKGRPAPALYNWDISKEVRTLFQNPNSSTSPSY
jgi:hypothetical protein